MSCCHLDLFCIRYIYFFFFFNDTASTEIYTLSLHDALPIWRCSPHGSRWVSAPPRRSSAPSRSPRRGSRPDDLERSEEHTSELQSLAYLVCRLLLEKKKKNDYNCQECVITPHHRRDTNIHD